MELQNHPATPFTASEPAAFTLLLAEFTTLRRLACRAAWRGRAESTSTVVAESQRQVGITFGFLILACAVVMVRVVTSGTNTGGVVVAILAGLFLVALIAGWIVRSRARARLEVTEDAIRYVGRDGRVSTLSRHQGDELRFVKRHAAALSRVWTLGLTIVGTDTVITPLSSFSRNEVRQACRALGWRFDDMTGSSAGRRPRKTTTSSWLRRYERCRE